MSLTVTCTSCRDPLSPRKIIQWAQNCAECAEEFIAKHLLEFPDHNIELTGSISRTPFGDVPKQIRQLFGDRRTA